MGLFPPFTCVVRFQARISRSFSLLSISMRFVANDDVSDDEIFYGQGIYTAYFFRINDANGRLLGIRPNGDGQRRASQDRCERASTCVVKSSRYFMAFLINDGAYYAFLNIYCDCSCLFYDFFTTLIFTLFLRRTRNGHDFNDDSQFKSVSGARFLIFRVLDRFR